jgi:DNA-binding winged helix-turn-helix (wHTH) protein
LTGRVKDKNEGHCPHCGQTLPDVRHSRPVVSVDQHLVRTDRGEIRGFTRRQIEILDLLVRRMPSVVSYRAFADSVWSLDEEGVDVHKSVVVHAYAIRKLLLGSGYVLRNLWGEGYALLPEAVSRGKVRSLNCR